MSTYPILIKQTIVRSVDITADNVYEAIDSAIEDYGIHGMELPSTIREEYIEVVADSDAMIGMQHAGNI